ncbi:MAG TPA: OB-fold nucleic acid binding domain-containing protein, partial [Syntrophorhabdaceae bacterium]|nr:OB-fold nucleic acid binding domain-containing protein [Syntrophorhabdaceae bacterium]
MEPTNELYAVRKEKEKSLKEQGIDTYPQDRGPYTTTKDVEERFGPQSAEDLEKNEERVAIAGRIMAFRDFGKSAFIHVQDRKGKMQAYIRKDILKSPAYDIFKKFDICDIVGLEGKVFKTKTGELTVLADSIKLLTKSLRPLPEKWHGLKDVEERYRKRYLDLIVNEKVRDVFT